jgi:arylsulfatase A-like enzyme
MRSHFANLRRFAVIAVALPAVMAVLPARGDQRQSSDNKGINVLLLMTDEQHHRSLSISGNPYIETPHMDRIGREGAVFRNATCVTPYCSPSRATLITGLYPHTHGILMNVSPGRNTQPPLDPQKYPNTETILHGRGYATAHRGKWHLGDKGDFDCYESWAYASQPGRGYRDFLDKQLPAAEFVDFPSPAKYQGRPVAMIPPVEKGYHEFYGLPNNRLAYISIIGRSVIPPDLLPETQITNQVLELLEENAHRRFFITASWSPPHDLWVIPEPYYSLVDRSKIQIPGDFAMPAWDQRGPSKRLGEIMGREGIREYMAIYYGMVKYIDDQVGRVLNKLDELGLSEKTLVVFTSDHGDMVGAHGCIGKSIFSFYDDLVRIPLLMRLPGQIPRGVELGQPVSQIDLMPTILDYVDAPVPGDIHGSSLRPLIEQRSVAWRDYALCQRADAARMLRTDDFKFTYRAKPRAVALYNMRDDAHENNNLADDPAYAATVQRMHRRLLELMQRHGDPQVERFTPDPLEKLE